MQSRKYYLPAFFGIELTAGPSAAASSAFLWLVLTLAGRFFLGISWTAALAGALACVTLHWFSEIWHQAGHAAAARRSGYPMRSVHLWFLLGFSRYPPDEPEVPGSVHLARALGGPRYSLLLTALSAGLFFIVSRTSATETVFWVAAFFALDNLFVFTLGALLPLGFTDGSTILKYWDQE